MARQIIVTGVTKQADGSVDVVGVYWLTAPANNTHPKPNFVSAVPPSSTVSWGVTTAELTALQNGTVVEQAFNSGQLSGLTPGQIETGLQNDYAVQQANLNTAAPTSKYIGAFWDGTTWTAAP